MFPLLMGHLTTQLPYKSPSSHSLRYSVSSHMNPLSFISLFTWCPHLVLHLPFELFSSQFILTAFFWILFSFFDSMYLYFTNGYCNFSTLTLSLPTSFLIWCLLVFTFILHKNIFVTFVSVYTQTPGLSQVCGAPFSHNFFIWIQFSSHSFIILSCVFVLKNQQIFYYVTIINFPFLN